MMYKNLCAELFVKGVTTEAVAKLLNATEKEIDLKFSGAADFRLLEVLAIRDAYLKDVTLDYMLS